MEHTFKHNKNNYSYLIARDTLFISLFVIKILNFYLNKYQDET